MDGSTGVWILGGYQSDFARNLTKEGRDFAALTAEVVDATVCDGRWETPDSRHEAACPSGSVAALSATADLRSGQYQSRMTGPGESWKAIENGEIEIGGRLPINPSGGLIGGGHPVGASPSAAPKACDHGC